MSQIFDRRFLLVGGAIVSVAAAGEAAAQNWWPFGRRDAAQNTQTAQNAPPPIRTRAITARQSANSALGEGEAAVVHALLHCDRAGEACLTHCLALLAAGDASMAACARGVREMLAVCGATRTLMQSQSALAAAQLAVCRNACAACRAACQPHAAHHAECGACAQSCAETIAAIDALLS